MKHVGTRAPPPPAPLETHNFDQLYEAFPGRLQKLSLVGTLSYLQLIASKSKSSVYMVKVKKIENQRMCPKYNQMWSWQLPG